MPFGSPVRLGQAASQASQPTGPSGLQRFAQNLGKAGISLASGIPAIQLDRMAAENAAIEANTAAQQQQASGDRAAAERLAETERLTGVALGEGPEADAAMNQLFALDPGRAEGLRTELGIRDQAGFEEAARDAAAIQALPFEQRRPAILERAARIEAAGDDRRANDTLSLLGDDEQTQNIKLRTVQAAALSAKDRLAGQGGTRADFTLSPGQTRFDPTGQPIASVEPDREAASLKAEERINKEVQQNLKTEEGLRKEFNTLLKDFNLVADANARVNVAGTNPTAAGDLALIFNFMKMLDPGSTVREGEFANAENSAGIPQRVRGQYNSIVNGQRLSETQRDDFLSRSGDLFTAAQEEAVKTADAYEGIARRAGVNPQNVVAAFEARREDAPNEDATNESAPQTAVNPQTGQRLILVNGQWVPADG